MRRGREHKDSEVRIKLEYSDSRSSVLVIVEEKIR